MEGVIRIRPLREGDLAWKRTSLLQTWGASSVARKGELVEALHLDGFAALDGSERVGLLTYAVRGPEFEVVTIHVDREHQGVGLALMNAAKARAEELRLRRMWLTTTNNNFRAFQFYQRWGMDLVAFYRDGVARSRLAKPSIPLVDGDGVPIRHELEFELLLADRE
ncbi:MAG: GNAT family N-acetyltransferase [Actinobacteria bacterium]|nr:GNAT family N-acetyltransferase [Actinomycetota bacterium]